MEYRVLCVGPLYRLTKVTENGRFGRFPDTFFHFFSERHPFGLFSMNEVTEN